MDFMSVLPLLPLWEGEDLGLCSVEPLAIMATSEEEEEEGEERQGGGEGEEEAVGVSRERVLFMHE